MKNIIMILIVFSLVCIFPKQVKCEDNAIDFAYFSYTEAIINSLSISQSYDDKRLYTDPSGLIILLGTIDSPKSRKLLIQLLDISLGAVHSEALTYAINLQGEKILSDLRNLLKQDVKCELLHGVIINPPANLKCMDRKSRDDKILWLIKMIENKEKYEYVL